jgi:hypothetical protein
MGGSGATKEHGGSNLRVELCVWVGLTFRRAGHRDIRPWLQVHLGCVGGVVSAARDTPRTHHRLPPTGEWHGRTCPQAN